MRREHLERLKPVCPTCRASGRAPSELRLGNIARCDGDDIREGALVCTESLCQREHPIIDGIPIVVADLQSWTSHQLDAVLRRDDLSPFVESLLGDAAGPGSTLDRERSTLSSYAYAHWFEGSIAQLLESALQLLSPERATGMWLDLGCAVGRATRDIALHTGDLAVGVDLSFSMLRVAEGVRREGRAVFDLRRVGVVYDRCDIAIQDVPGDHMSFWCCDVGNLPFPEGLFAGGLSLNVLDCVASPVAHLLELSRVMRPGAPALLSTPYDWSPNATPLAQWLGGHSQRGPAHGSSVTELHRVLSSMDIGLRVEMERERIPWRVYVNERATMEYAVHLLSLRRADCI